MMAFGAGAVYGLNRSRIEEFVRKNYCICLTLAVVLFVSVGYIPFVGQKYWIAHNIKSIAFAAIVVMATMKITVDSMLLKWSGEHLFPLYIYQRIPMIVLFSLFPISIDNWRILVCLALSLLVAITIAILYPKVQICFRLHERN